MKLREWDKGMLLTLGVVGVFVLHRLLVILVDNPGSLRRRLQVSVETVALKGRFFVQDR